MAWINSIEILSKLIPIAQILIVVLTIFTIWATVQRGRLEKQEKTKLTQEVQKKAHGGQVFHLDITFGIC